jgi:FtsH-binding integral membrane protein
MIRKDQEHVAKHNKQAVRSNRFLNPTQQWLALTLLAILVVIAIFYFGVGLGPDGGQPG